MEDIKILNSKKYQNLFLFNYMKDNEAWLTFTDSEGRCRYKNPLNASYLGLRFHCEHSWLQAVKEKVEDYFICRHYLPEWSIEKLKNEYCGILLVRNPDYNETLTVSHEHGETELETNRRVLISAVEYITHKNN